MKDFTVYTAEFKFHLEGNENVRKMMIIVFLGNLSSVLDKYTEDLYRATQ